MNILTKSFVIVSSYYSYLPSEPQCRVQTIIKHFKMPKKKTNKNFLCNEIKTDTSCFKILVKKDSAFRLPNLATFLLEPLKTDSSCALESPQQ